MEALDKASKEFKKLRKENDQWVISYDINKYIKNAPYNKGKAFTFTKRILLILARN
jgi:hypothetical protein